MPSDSNAIARSDALTFSPVEINASDSLLFGVELKDFESSIKRSVSPLIADTTTITFEFFVAASMILATCAILSVEPTEVPPNF